MLAFFDKKKIDMGLASNETKGTVLVISILVASYVLFFVFQITNEFATLSAVFTANKQDQIEITKAVATLTNVKFHEIEGILRNAESKDDLQNLVTQGAGQPETARVLGSIQNALLLVEGAEKNEVTLIDSSNNRVVASQGSLAQFQPGESISDYAWANQVEGSKSPVFSGVYSGIDKEEDLVSFLSPILNEQGSLGTIAITLPAAYLESGYHQLDPPTTTSATTTTIGAYSYIAILDGHLDFLSSSDSNLVGTSLAQDAGEVQDGIDPSVALQSAFSNESDWTGDAVYRNSEGEFLITAQPITFFGKPEYLVVIKSNTADFYSQVEPVLYQNRIQMFSVLAATTVLTIAIASFINRNINLDKQVKAKTRELLESNTVVTAQKIQLEKANEELKRLDVLKTEFIGIASHELKTPIQPILLYAELAREGDVEKDAALDIIFKQATKLKQLSQDILDVSRIDSKSLVLEKQPVRIVELIQDAIMLQKGKLRPSVSIVLDAEENAIISIDGPRISQVLSNLLDNAIKFTQEGTITVKERTIVAASGQEAYEKKQMIEISVTDKGIGISEEILPRLFGKFITKAANGLNSQGTGLGLFICKGIVEAHAGKIWAENNKGSGGRGATFTFTLPLA